jgi:hypothetical protein
MPDDWNGLSMNDVAAVHRAMSANDEPHGSPQIGVRHGLPSDRQAGEPTRGLGCRVVAALARHPLPIGPRLTSGRRFNAFAGLSYPGKTPAVPVLAKISVW